MHENVNIDQNLSKAEKYRLAELQIAALLQGEPNRVANLANTSAALKEIFGFFWVGFYLLENDVLVLGPFQGTVACTRLFRGKGVCAAAWESNATVVVPDVDAFPGHVACSSASKSEIVVPVRNTAGEVIGVLDVDSDQLNDFDAIDQQGLERIVKVVEAHL
jgi:GAF domain-containing protein